MSQSDSSACRVAYFTQNPFSRSCAEHLAQWAGLECISAPMDAEMHIKLDVAIVDGAILSKGDALQLHRELLRFRDLSDQVVVHAQIWPRLLVAQVAKVSEAKLVRSLSEAFAFLRFSQGSIQMSHRSATLHSQQNRMSQAA